MFVLSSLMLVIRRRSIALSMVIMVMRLTYLFFFVSSAKKVIYLNKSVMFFLSPTIHVCSLITAKAHY